MSFILDALKKSESERNRQSGPALLEVRVAPPRSRLPVWAIVIVVALVANVLVLGYLLLRPARVTTAAVATPVVPATAPPAAPVAAAATLAAAPPAARTALPDPALATTPLPAAAALAPPDVADYEPALAARRADSALPPPSAAALAADMGLPSFNDLNASGAGLPELHLSLHVYDTDPTRRYVLLNSTRLREGESTPDGIRLERITEAGVILAWRNRRFTLQRGE
jgi:general secretion pathway protein B